MSSPTKLDAIVTQNLFLRQLFDRAAVVDRLNQQIRDILPEALAAHFSHATQRDGCLTLVVDSPAWAGKFRYFLPELNKTLSQQRNFPEFSHIRVAVSRHQTPIAPPVLHTNPVTATGAAELHRQAETIGDEALAAALRRLASRSTKS